MVDKVNVMKVREWLEKGDGRELVMRTWTCGTTACLGGKAELIMAEESGMGRHSTMEVAGWLDLTEEQVDDLFYMESTRFSMSEFDALKPAVRRLAGMNVLDILMKEDVVDWDRAITDAMEEGKG